MKTLNKFSTELASIDTGNYVVLFKEIRSPRWQIGLGYNSSGSTRQITVDQEDPIFKEYNPTNSTGSMHKNLNNAINQRIVNVSLQVVICSVLKSKDNTYSLHVHKKLHNTTEIEEFKQSLNSQ